MSLPSMITLSSDHHLSGSINMLFGKVYKYATKGISFVGQMLKNQKKLSPFKWLKNTQDRQKYMHMQKKNKSQ